MIRFLASVSFKDLQPQAALAIVMSDQVYQEHGIPETWITSANDKRHKTGSLHYSGHAFDLRVHNIPREKHHQVHQALKKRLSPGFDVLYEIDHIHVEYDPT
jgi:hypothetical protein